MSFKKIAVVVSSILFLSTLLLSQSLVEAAKKEKERRESLKGKKRVVATNAEIVRLRKRTATSTSRTETISSTTSPRTESDRRSSSPRTESDRRSSSRTDQGQESVKEDEKSFRQRRAAIEQKWEKTQEYSDLLATKMNGLWQEFYNLGSDMTYRGKIQADISETYLKLQRSREEEAKAKQELDVFLEEARKRGVPPGWLR